MVEINGRNITLSRGDTASFKFGSGRTDWGANDRALFTVKNSAGTIVLQTINPLDADGAFDVVFSNSTTDTWTVGAYSYDVRYVVSPAYDEEGNIIDGIEVITPADPATITIKTTIGEV